MMTDLPFILMLRLLSNSIDVIRVLSPSISHVLLPQFSHGFLGASASGLCSDSILFSIHKNVIQLNRTEPVKEMY